MKQKMFSIYDTISEVFNKPFCEHNDASAIRAFSEAIKDNPNKDDFVLYAVGEYNDNSGELTPLIPCRISSGLEIKSNVTHMPENLKKQSGV